VGKAGQESLRIHQGAIKNVECLVQDTNAVTRCANQKQGRKFWLFSILRAIHNHGETLPITDYRPENLNEIIRKPTMGGLCIIFINKLMDKMEVLRHPDHFIYRFIKYV
jgi:hypothetical protein